MIAVFAVTAWWVAFEKGLASAAHEMLYRPALILAVIVLTLLSAGFHEIGHAAACRYGGARPGRMGIGLYLLWPAFYTDVTDSYRLGRGGRLRVDLGGLYFNAVWGVATFGVWALTGADALLLVVGAQLLLMVRQLVPFVRFDGYHILADLVGVPDLFMHIKPTLLGLVPARRRRGEREPAQALGTRRRDALGRSRRAAARDVHGADGARSAARPRDGLGEPRQAGARARRELDGCRCANGRGAARLDAPHLPADRGHRLPARACRPADRAEGVARDAGQAGASLAGAALAGALLVATLAVGLVAR